MDKRALKILFDRHWTSGGWTTHRPPLAGPDFDYAKAHGVMFDPVKASHDQDIARMRAAADALTPRAVADGFLASLSTRRLEWRSALGSYAVARSMPEHAQVLDGAWCRTCGLLDDARATEHDPNASSFERFKWGGVHHADPDYAALDLECFRADPPTAPTAADIEIFRALVAALSAVPPSTRGTQLHKFFPESLKASKQERDVLVGILGLCGILGTAAHPGFFSQFTPQRERAEPDGRGSDMAYPANWWRASDGVNQQRLGELFGHVL